MSKKIIYSLIIVIILSSLVGCGKKKIQENTKTETNTVSNDINNENENSSEDISEVKIIINEKQYIINLEENETAKSLTNHLPLNLNMSELNGNEKYAYLDFNLPTISKNPKRINTGDVMLYGDNCLVIFYKSFDTSYSYTKIGHIDNLPDLGKGSIEVNLEK